MIDKFIDFLAHAAVPPFTFNPYSYHQPENDARRHNLQHYLRRMHQMQPTALLVGEAPGYRGCRLTGIPFVSPDILVNLFGMANDWQTVPEWPDIQKEASATIVWQTLVEVQIVPLLWNAFPFHPHQPDKLQSNRTPKRSELEWGRPFLIQLLQIFPVQIIVAVGNKADQALTEWEIGHTKVRHPSHGGKMAFTQGISRLLGSL